MIREMMQEYNELSEKLKEIYAEDQVALNKQTGAARDKIKRDSNLFAKPIITRQNMKETI